MNVIECEKTKLLEEFRNQVEDLQQTDSTLRRYLKARNYNLQDAEAMLRKSVQWRKENDIDNALNWNINEELYQKVAAEYSGVDYQNRAVIYAAIGSWPVRELLEAGCRDEMLRNFYVALERTTYEVEKSGEQGFFIVNLAEATYSKFIHYETMQYIMLTFRIFEAHYPERLGEIYVINAPYLFDHFWPIFKPFLTGNTLSKLTVFGTDEDKYMDALLEKIPPSSIPDPLRKLLKRIETEVSAEAI